MSQSKNMDAEVRKRYSEASKALSPALCCPVDYNQEYLKVIPKEVIERDYGCGNPGEFVEKGDHVLDLGSGAGKICFIASQITGPEGFVTGVDCNDDMLDLANKASAEVFEKTGMKNVKFLRGRIEDLRLKPDWTESYLKDHPIRNCEDLANFEFHQERQKSSDPLIQDHQFDLVVSNCVLNLVATHKKADLMKEVYRVLKPGGRAVISDIVSAVRVPKSLQEDPELWSGCISGAFQEAEFLEAFRVAGFDQIEILKREETPWQVVQGIEFRSLTVRAGKQYAPKLQTNGRQSQKSCC